MSDTCIVCLGDLSLGIDGVAEQSTIAVAKSPTAEAQTQIVATRNDPTADDLPPTATTHLSTTVSELIAHLQPCGHDLHDECLKPWVERANSCPICRSCFHLVELKDYVGGPIVSSYAVQDKTQVAEVDPSLFLEIPDEYDEEQVCQVCQEGDNEDILMYCDGCGKLWHTYCADLDEVPYAAWFCENCTSERATDPQLRSQARRSTTAPSRRRTRGLERRWRNNNANQDDGWNQVWQTVWSSLGIDLDWPEGALDNDERAATMLRRHRQAVESSRREQEAFEARMRVAEWAGAGNRFRAAHSALASRPPPESAEETAAWDAFAEAQGGLHVAEAASPPNRKRKSRTSSPAHAEPTESSPRENKRRRTSTPAPRIPLPRPRPSRGQRSNNLTSPPRASPLPRPRTVLDNAAPSFLQSLLQEVEESSGPSGSSLHRPIIRNPGSPAAEQNSPRPSSPATSNPSSPRAMSATPPPVPNGFRPSSPPGLSSSIQPVYPQSGFSPGLGSSSDAEETSPGPQSPQLATRIPVSAAPPIAKPKPRRPRIPPESSPSRTRSHEPSNGRATLSADKKADVQKLVSAALKPHYHEQKISKDEYTIINRDVSRMLYDKIGDFEALDLEGKARWAEVAGEEVGKAVSALRV